MGFESRTTSYSQWESLTAAVKSLRLIPQGDQVETLRQIKDADEILQIREAIRQAERGVWIADCFAVWRDDRIAGGK